MTIKNIFVILFAFSILAVNAQKKIEKESPDVNFELAIQKYHNSLKYVDYSSAINALQEILVINPEKVNYKDSLLAMYYNSGRSNSAVLLAKEMEAEGNSNPATFQVLASTFQNAGMLKEALPYYEKLNKTKEGLYYLYQIATIQFNLSRLQECTQSLSKIIQNPEAAKQTIAMEYEKQETQQIPYAAAAYNVLGVMALQFKENEKAKGNFTKALELAPEFLLAKNNLSVLNK